MVTICHRSVFEIKILELAAIHIFNILRFVVDSNPQCDSGIMLFVIKQETC